MKKPLSKRSQPWARAAVYTLMTVSVVVLVTLLMLIVLGYSFNQRDGKLEQGGLLQFASIPSGATVTLDELVLGSRTSTKTTVDAGSHSVDFNLNGYRTWKKSITVGPGQIGWVNYARLVPTKLTPENVRTFTGITSSLASPRHNYIVATINSDKPEFELINIQGDAVRYATLTLPEGTYTEVIENGNHVFRAESWSQNENAVLVKHTYGEGQAEWIYLDRNDPKKSVNINATFGIAPSKLVFGGDGSRLMFVQSDDIVRRINLDDLTLSRPLVSNVSHFEAYDEKSLAYVASSDDGKRTVGYAATDMPQPVIIKTYPQDDKQLFSVMETYFNKRYFTVLHGDQLAIYGGELPTLTNKGSLKSYATITVPEGAQEVTMSRNGRFTLVRTAEGFATYDMELKKYDVTKWAYQSQNQRPIQWLDDYMLWSDNDGQARIYDFDGGNQQNIMRVIEGNAVTVTNNNKYLYGFTGDDKGVHLTRVKMIIN